MSDAWKGEHLIRGWKPTKAERRTIGMKVISNMSHERRRRAGREVAGQAEHDEFVARLLKTVHQINGIAAEEAGGKRK